MIAMCCQLPSTTMSATITSADANPSPSATHASSSNQVGATRNHYTTEMGSADPNYGALWSPVVATGRNQFRGLSVFACYEPFWSAAGDGGLLVKCPRDVHAADTMSGRDLSSLCEQLV